MVRLTINIPDDQVDRVLEAFARAYGYRDEVPADPPPPVAPDPDAPAPTGGVGANVPPGGGFNPDAFGTKPNPEDKKAFAKRMLVEHMLNIIRSHEVAEAQIKAQETAKEKVDKEIKLS